MHMYADQIKAFFKCFEADNQYTAAANPSSPSTPVEKEEESPPPTPVGESQGMRSIMSFNPSTATAPQIQLDPELIRSSGSMRSSLKMRQQGLPLHEVSDASFTRIPRLCRLLHDLLMFETVD